MLQAIGSTIDTIIFVPFILYSTLFIFGLIFGSFFKVVVDRSVDTYALDEEPESLSAKICRQLCSIHNKIFSGSKPEKQDKWYEGRSRCDHCQHIIAWHDNIPLFSYLILKGRCRYCDHQISISHLVVELLTGLVFVFAGYLSLTQPFFANWPALAITFFWVSVVAILWLILLFDWYYLIIPDELVLMLSLFAVSRLVSLAAAGSLAAMQLDLTAAFSFLVVFLLLRYLPLLLTKKVGMGWGDIKLIFPLVLVIGYRQALVGVFCAFIIGGVWGIILLATRRAKMGQMVSFGPLLVIGSMIGLGWGLDLWQYYWQFLIR